MSTDRLFTPLRLGNLTLAHRIVMAPLTRFRATDAYVPGPYAKEYYAQRASVPGSLLITEATYTSPRASGGPNIPGIWNDEQVGAWREITDAVHARGSFIIVQLAALGRVASPDVLRGMEGGPFKVVISSATALDEAHALPKAMTEEDIRAFVDDYAQAARNAMRAGFDGVEIHGANGYLIDQFWQDVVNTRTDGYGGSILNRACFGLEITRAVFEAVGDSSKVGMRLSPWSTYQGMRMADPIPQFLYIVQDLKKLEIAYIHLVESRISGGAPDGVYQTLNPENKVLVDAWGDEDSRPVLLAGGFTHEKAKEVMGKLYTGGNVGIVFGRQFLSNPDLPFRLQEELELNAYDRSTFYAPKMAKGYIDYPFIEEWMKLQS